MFLPVPNGSRLDIIFKLKQRGSEMHFVDAKWILTGSGGHYGMNIYRGCTHGCIYCDSRSRCYQFTHPFEDIEVKQKDGTVKVIQKYKRKKRFGRSINRRAPARFLLELKRKAEAVGGVYAEVDTKEFKASQYNHVTDTYEKIPLSQREKEIGNRKVQRDLYSAFLIRNADLDFKHPDREKCEYEFEDFANLQDQLILKMKESGLSMRQCFGF